MKDYDRIIIWSDYFNSSLSRSEGRRIPLNKAIRNPKLIELEKAATRIGYKPASVNAFHPKRTNIESGYISIERVKAKTQIINEMSALLPAIRGEQRRDLK
jgi:signal recognition particle subunit SRP19